MIQRYLEAAQGCLLGCLVELGLATGLVKAASGGWVAARPRDRMKVAQYLLPPPMAPEPPNKRCCACGQAYGPSNNHRCESRPEPQPKELAALRLLDAAEYIYTRFELHGDTKYLDAAIRAFKESRGLDTAPRDEDELCDRVWSKK